MKFLWIISVHTRNWLQYEIYFFTMATGQVLMHCNDMEVALSH